MSDLGSRHLRGLPGVEAVNTPGMRLTAAAVKSSLRNGEIVVVVGDAGLGKSFAVDQAVRTAGRPWLWVQVGPKPRPKEVTVRLVKALTGVKVDGPLYDLTDELVALLAEDQPIVVIDEAQNLDTDGVEQLRFIHDQVACGFPLLLVGNHTCEARLRSHAQLSDRVARWVRFAPLDGRNLHSTLNAYHPYFEATEPAVIDRVNTEYARGVFRRWAMVLKEGIPLSAANNTPGMLPASLVAPLLRSLGEKAVA